jgi:CRISPR-associated protein Csb2
VVARIGPLQSQSVPETHFAPDAVVLESRGGFVPGLEGFPSVAARLREALMSQAAGPLPPLLTGRDAGGPARAPHIAIVPLANVGWPHAAGQLMGLALVWPRGATESPEAAPVWRAIMSFLSQGELHFGRAGTWRLGPVDSARASLRFERYLGPARRWATVLPAALDRYTDDGEDLARVVARAGVQAGLPEEAVRDLAVHASPFSSVKGAPLAREVWQVLPPDSPYRKKPVVHLLLEFKDPVRGPLLLGAGRYRGLGFCLPLDSEVDSYGT